ncbi:hypothetical protein [Pseudomonas oryzihabitans]|uniref:hypothetical protein n=1 Tax=Pseudomonas oryzihabitans TaxID=47885 RepID=UPI0011A28698|nr:hypothetical protein [Pseudomonas psychrotolerans]
MKGLGKVLASLDPPVKHLAEWRSEGLMLTLIDPGVPAKVTRLISKAMLSHAGSLNLIILHAVNELRLRGSHVPLDSDMVLLPLS